MATTETKTRSAKGQSARLSVHLTPETTGLVRAAQAAEADRLRRAAPVTTYVDVLVAQAAQELLEQEQVVALTKAGAVAVAVAEGGAPLFTPSPDELLDAAVNDADSDEELTRLEHAFAALRNLAEAGQRAALERKLGAASLIATRIVARTADLASAIDATVASPFRSGSREFAGRTPDSEPQARDRS